jgi:hypothetical protein
VTKVNTSRLLLPPRPAGELPHWCAPKLGLDSHRRWQEGVSSDALDCVHLVLMRFSSWCCHALCRAMLCCAIHDRCY